MIHFDFSMSVSVIDSQYWFRKKLANIQLLITLKTEGEIQIECNREFLKWMIVDSLH